MSIIEANSGVTPFSDAPYHNLPLAEVRALAVSAHIMRKDPDTQRCEFTFRDEFGSIGRAALLAIDREKSEQRTIPEPETSVLE